MKSLRAPLAAILVAAALLLPSMAFAQDAAPAAGFYADAPEAARTAIESSKALAAEGKWLSAWKTLDGADPENKDGFILAAKVDIALNGYAQTAMHLIFGFVDLEPGMDLATARETAFEDIEPVEFDPFALSQGIEAAGGAMPPVLSMELGDFFFDVHLMYPNQWVEEDQTVVSLGLAQYERAIAYETYTPASLRKHAELLAAAGNPAGAESVIRKALALSADDLALKRLLLDSLVSQSRLDEGFVLLDELIAKSEDPSAKYALFVKGVQMGLEAGQIEKAEIYTAALETNFPDDYLAGLIRHLVAVNSGDEAGANAAADGLAARFPGNSEILSTLLGTWLSAGLADQGFAFIDRNIPLAGTDDATLALMYFYRALLGAETAQGPEGFAGPLADLATAEGHFRAVNPEDPVFETIAQLRTQWTAVPEATAAPEAAAPAEAVSAAPAETGDATSAASE